MSTYCDVSGFYFKWGEPRTYGPLGILETVVKILATGVSIASLSVYSNNSTRILSVYRIIEGSFLTFFSVWFLVQFIHRLIDKEMFAIIFMLLLLLGNGVINVVAFISDEGQSGSYIFVVAFLMILGELIKLMHICLVEESHITWPIYFSKRIVLVISAINIFFWVVVLVVQILALTISYTGTNQAS